MPENFEMSNAKRRKVSVAGTTRRTSQATTVTQSPKHQRVMAENSSPQIGGNVTPQGQRLAESRESDSVEPGTSAPSPILSKPRRVRTGCLTCRNRHLKCDEAMPICLNCQKSNRKCERGVRLNFIDLKVEQPPYLLPPVDWKVQFQDESRHIASEYVGGLARYAKLGQQVATPIRVAAADAEPDAHRAIDPALAGHRQYVDNSRMGHPQSVLGLYYPGSLSRSLHEPPYNAYDGHMGQMFSHKASDPYLAMASDPTPTSSHSGGGGGRNAFALGPMHDPYGVGEETTAQPIHGYKPSDVSSAASSFVPQGLAVSSSGSFRHATGSGAPDPHEGLMTPQSEKNGERDYLNCPEELQYMQVFIEEVAVWMDSLDNQKHFGRVIPYLALKSPMLLNAFLACGVRHLVLVDGGSYKDDKALHYYDTATTQLLRSLQNPERNMAECATTAVVLNVYEIMSEKPAARMNHIAGARALIRECKWDATSTGIGAACFWLNVGMEVLSCLAFNWATAWDPDHWGMNPGELMQMSTSTPGSEGRTPKAHGGGARVPFPAADEFPSTTSNVGGVGEEEIWVHRILYIIAKVASFRANIPQFQEPSPHDEQVRQQSRFAEWQQLKTWCDTWNANCPRSMRPYGYLFASTTKSAFPHVWLIKRSAIVGRLFYHTAMCLLAQINPLATHDDDDDESRPVQLHHAHQVCGIVAHSKDHGIASVAIRSLAIAGSVLTIPREQHEVLDILHGIYHRTGWNLNRVHLELKRAWGWEPPEASSSCTGPGSNNSANPAALPQPTPSVLPPSTSSQGGTMGAAAVISQLFGPRITEPGDNNNARPVSQPPPPAPIHPPAMTTLNETRRANFTTGPPPPSTTLTQPLFSAALAQQQRHSSVTSAGGGSSNHTSPAAAGGSAHTPGASSTSNNAPTPPNSNNRVNPLLAQADFTQPNHPYREWYKPPESRTTPTASETTATATATVTATVTATATATTNVTTTTAIGGFKAGSLWPY